MFEWELKNSCTKLPEEEEEENELDDEKGEKSKRSTERERATVKKECV